MEYIRLLEQALSQLGFEGAAAQLQRESGVALEAPEIGRLRAAVLAGDFTEAVQLLGQLPLSDYEYRRAEFALLEQNFLEVSLCKPLSRLECTGVLCVCYCFCMAVTLISSYASCKR